MKIYEYSNCSTCKKALKFLDSQGISYKKMAIVETPPSSAELKEMLQNLKAQGLDIKKMFNTSGLVYKEMKLSEKLPNMSEAEALKLLASDGKLIKRPFVIGDKKYLLGFKEDEWMATFKK